MRTPEQLGMPTLVVVKNLTRMGVDCGSSVITVSPPGGSDVALEVFAISSVYDNPVPPQHPAATPACPC